jgi:RNA polymerase sigma-70 factor (ECF subfamily)
MRLAEARLIQQLRQGDLEAGHQFVRDYYPDVYRYLLYLTGRMEIAEDLTQETFLQAWHGLTAFEGRASLRVWLHRIARREFLQVLRSQRLQASLEEVAEHVTAPEAGWVEAVELQDVVRKLPAEQSEVVVLHYLHGYSCAEIARIVGAHVSTIKYRLSVGRLLLERELGEGDLLYLNEPSMPMRQWAWLPLDHMYALATRLTRGGTAGSDTSRPGVTTEENMERREFLRQTAVGAAGLMLSEADKDIVDRRLTQKVTCAFKGAALSDLCDRLRRDTGIQLIAGPSVADEKVTLFCEKMPLRELMRQLSRPFGYTWLRSGKPGEFRYELAQDLKSQLLEEELRNRDRNAAFLSLEQEIEQYRPYLDLSPDEALARAKTAPPAEKPLLEKLASFGWGPIHMYFRLSHSDLTALRGGQKLTFSGAPEPGEHPLPPDLARGVFQSYRGWRVYKERDLSVFSSEDPPRPDSVPLADVPEVRAAITLTMPQSELGQFTLGGSSRIFFPRGAGTSNDRAPYAVGRSPAVLKPDNERLNAKCATDPALHPRVDVQPQPSCRPRPAASTSEGSAPEPKVTTADVLEALYRATGIPIVADYYTRLYKPSAVSARNQALFETLNQLADTMGLRWNKEASWLQFRSASYYDDRLKEVPNRLLERWASLRRKQGALTLDDLIEIAQLPDVQLDGTEMAEGARECFGLAEWDLPRSERLRPHLRFLASFTPTQRHDVVTPEGLPFTRMSLAQQQQFITEATLYDPLSLEELAGASMRVDYSQPGEFQWGNPDLDWHWSRWVIILEHGRQGRWAPRPLLRARTREAVMQAVLRLDPKIREGAVHSFRSQRPTPEPEPPVPLEAQVFPTRLSLTFIYFPAASNYWAHIEGSGATTSWQILY